MFPSCSEGCGDGSCSNFSFVRVTSVNRNPEDAAKHMPPQPMRCGSVTQRMCGMPFCGFVGFWLVGGFCVWLGWFFVVFLKWSYLE